MKKKAKDLTPGDVIELYGYRLLVLENVVECYAGRALYRIKLLHNVFSTLARRGNELIEVLEI